MLRFNNICTTAMVLISSIVLAESATCPAGIPTGQFIGEMLPGSFTITTTDSTSDRDTELAIWNAAGQLLLENDDAGDCPAELQLDLDEGVYVVVGGQTGLNFGEDYSVNVPPSDTYPKSGDFILRINNAIDPDLTATEAIGPGESAYGTFCFAIAAQNESKNECTFFKRILHVILKILTFGLIKIC